MSRVYSVVANDITIAGASTLIYLRPSATQAIEIIEARVGFTANATSAQVRVQLLTHAVAGSPASTAATPLPLDLGNTQTPSITGGTGNMAAGTAGVDVSTESSGARSVLVSDAFNVLNGWLWVPGPDGKIIIPANSGSAFCLYLPTAPGTLTNWQATVVFREL